MSMVQCDDGEGGTEGGGEEQMVGVRPAALCEGEEGLSEEDYLDMMQQIEEAVMAEILEQGLFARPPLCACSRSSASRSTPLQCGAPFGSRPALSPFAVARLLRTRVCWFVGLCLRP